MREGQRSGKAQRVILKAKPGYDAWARKLLAQRGKNIDAELPSIGGFAVELAAGELEAFCNASVFDGCSEDSIVTPTARRLRRRHRALAGHPVYSAPAVNTLLGTLGLTP